MYQGIVTSITTAPIEGADRIKKGFCQGFTVVVGVDTKDGDLGIFFPCDGRLSERMLRENKLLKDQGGYFADNGRVRAQTFRKVKSEGIWLPVESIAWTGSLKGSPGNYNYSIGDLVDTCNGELICEKYYTPATLRAMAHGQQVKFPKRGETPWFKKQPDTPQLRYVIEAIPDGSLIYFTEKLHGTSGRYGLALETKQTWWRKLLRLPVQKEWTYLLGSKNVILTHKPGAGYYADETFRSNTVEGIVLHKGETLYYEIVGSTTTNTLIMPGHELKDPKLKKLYGSHMQYTYGCFPGQAKIFVYRITRTNEDGVVTELSWPQVKGRCEELGVSYCPELIDGPIHKDIYANNQLHIQGTADHVYEGPSTLDSSHIREGVVLRIERPDGRIEFAKHKSYDFKVLEGIIKEDVNYVDREEIA